MKGDSLLHVPTLAEPVAPSSDAVRAISPVPPCHDIGLQTRRMTDLESGEPCIETLEWLKREFPADVFKQTLKQIIDHDGYTCDEETVAWARRQWDAAEQGAPPDRGGD